MRFTPRFLVLAPVTRTLESSPPGGLPGMPVQRPLKAPGSSQPCYLTSSGVELVLRAGPRQWGSPPTSWERAELVGVSELRKEEVSRSLGCSKPGTLLPAFVLRVSPLAPSYPSF